jgi:hypothetical protein
MAKSKDVTTKDCLEILRRFEAVEVTMKKLEGPSDTHVDASYAADPTMKSQKNGFKNRRQSKPRSEPDSKPDRNKPCIWCNGDNHPRSKCPAKDAACKFCGKQGHFDRACLVKKSKHQHAVDVTFDQDSSDYEYEDEFDLGAVSIHAINNHESREVFAPVVFRQKGDNSLTFTVTGKVDTGAMVTCMPASMLPQVGLSRQQMMQFMGYALSLPKPELMVFDGNPLSYWQFIRSFERSI